MSGFDPISLEIMWNRLINIAEECWITIYRTSFSTIMGEAQDFGIELLDAEGNSMAHGPRSMPVFNLTLPMAVKALLQRYPPESLREGDVLITNDPWVCAGHLYDLAVVTPVFQQGKLVGMVGSVGHCSDIGGTRDSLKVREIYEEGLQIPPLKLYDAGQLNETLADLIRANVRKGEMVFGDLQAQVTANRVGAERLVSFMAEYQLSSLTGLANVIQDRAEGAMRAAIRAVPDGEYRHELLFDGIGKPLLLPVKITVSADELVVDYEGAPPQLPIGGINCTMSYTAAHTTYAIKAILTPDIPSNAGCYRPIRVTAPEGSILNCRYPVAVNMRTMTGWYCAPLVFAALAPVLPDRVQAFTGMPMGAYAYGRDDKGRVFSDYLFQGGGQGGSAHGDGQSALLFPTSAGNVSVEMFETRTTILVECKEFIPDSAGAGRRRGGLGQRVRIRKLLDDSETILIGLHPQGLLVPTPGLFGGSAGRKAALRLEEPGRTLEGLQIHGLAELNRPDQRLTIEIAGGAGYGDPLERSLEAVAADLEQGLITPEGARRYGVTVSADGRPQRNPQEEGVAE